MAVDDFVDTWVCQVARVTFNYFCCEYKHYEGYMSFGKLFINGISHGFFKSDSKLYSFS